MRLRPRRVVLALLVLLGAPSDQNYFQPLPGAYPSINNKTFAKQCVDAHNKHRAAVKPSASNMLYMTWDVALARTARAWANRCTFKHSPYRKSHPDSSFWLLGENLWMSNAVRRHFDPTGPIASWNSEVKSYKFNSHQCERVCGHYTQIVWDVSYKVGCAIVFCRKTDRSKNIEIFVCNYGPGGNFPRRPYLQGKPCSACPHGDTCEKKLCRNPERDKVIRYTRWYPHFEHRIICDESCIALAILRPLLMFIAFGIVYYLQKRYPNLSIKQ
ncbi:glioma pathogenesis-related protein 1-like [Sphaerodactylus townsendi]|uniref:glioma pathogenesis-related protein 1-like n=1 Tax=Sphaerodactylus townsendi TaxID=933632 RepID=UPI00202630FC|nr:glioma pathogenesis-related protein 1-like [Sphaerodactylus townsendi]